MGKIYIDFYDLNEDMQEKLMEESMGKISDKKRKELEELAFRKKLNYTKLIMAEAISNLPKLDVEYLGEYKGE